jgi:hypothetical protein
MATTFESIPADQRADFLKRLAIYGLEETSVLQPDLVVPSQTTMTLSSVANSFLTPHVLTTTDLDELKNWIGIPDKRFEGGLRSAFSKTHIPLPKKLSVAAPGRGAKKTIELAEPTARAFSSADNDKIRLGAMSYLWGNSAHVADFKSIVEAAIGRFQVVVWPFFTITVNRGAVLEIGSGANVLCAWKIIIQEGGQVRGLDTNLHVQCTILQKQQLFIRQGVTTKLNTSAVARKIGR